MRHFLACLFTLLFLGLATAANASDLCWRDKPNEGFWLFACIWEHPDVCLSLELTGYTTVDGVNHFTFMPGATFRQSLDDQSSYFYLTAGGEARVDVLTGGCTVPLVIPQEPDSRGDFNCDGQKTVTDTLIHLQSVVSGLPLQECP